MKKQAWRRAKGGTTCAPWRRGLRATFVKRPKSLWTDGRAGKRGAGVTNKGNQGRREQSRWGGCNETQGTQGTQLANLQNETGSTIA